MSGCETMEAANPVSWFEDEEGPAPEVKTAAEEETAVTPGGGKDFPDVNEVPEKPATESSVEQRRAMMQELAADKANAQYIEEKATQSTTETVEVAESGGGTEVMAAASETETESMAAQAPAGGTAAGGEAPPAGQSEDEILDLDSPLPPRDPGPPPLTENNPPPAPPAPPSATPEPPGEAVAAPSPGSSEIDDVYEQKLQESAPTVTTAVPGPTASPSGAGAATGAGGAMGSESVMQDAPPPPQFEPSKSPAVQAERQMAAATSPGFVTSSTQLATIYFGNNSASIRDSEAKKIRDVVQTYKERGGKLRVYGYASSRTADMSPVQHQIVNFNVSVQRADAVARALIQQGVKAEDIQTQAFSDSQPVYYEVMPAGEAGNRRVEIFVDYY